MLIQVDVKSLINNNLKVDEFLLLQLINDKEFDLFSKYLAMYPSEEKDKLFNRLNQFRFVTNKNDLSEYDPSKIEIGPDFGKVLANGDYFDELVQVFPVSVVRPDGTKDFLRTDLKRCRVTYSKITKNKLFIHQHILDCLKFEILLKNKQGKMGYFKKLPKWLLSEEWIVYEQQLKDATIDTFANTEVGYGNKLE